MIKMMKCKMLIGTEIEKKSCIWNSCLSVHYNANLCDAKNICDTRYSLNSSTLYIEKTQERETVCCKKYIIK